MIIRIWTDNLKKAQKTHQKQITFAQKQLLEQKRDYSVSYHLFQFFSSSN